MFLISGAKVNIQDRCGVTPVMASICVEDWNTSTHLVKIHKASLVETNRFNGQNILHCLAKTSDYSEIEDLVEQAVKQNPELVSQCDMHGNTPLHIAMLYHNFEIVQPLLGNRNIFNGY